MKIEPIAQKADYHKHRKDANHHEPAVSQLIRHTDSQDIYDDEYEAQK